MFFKCDPDIKIYANGWYDYDDLSTAVGYWANFLQREESERPLGVIVNGSITFSGVAFLLALYQTKTNFVYLNPNLDYANHEFTNRYNLHFRSLVIMGENKNLRVPALIVSTEDFFHSYNISKKKFKSSLEFVFDKNHTVICPSSGSTGVPKLIYNSASEEAVSIQTAIDTYFDPDDVCLFSHEMTHIGVHTTAILPALFSVKKIFLLTTQEWPQFVEQATHCQWFVVMREFYKLTPNLKKITFGGTKLSKSTANFILEQSPDATIYDIYGLTESLPPVAIRKINKDHFPEQFEMCREDLTFKIGSHGRLTIVNRLTGHEILTGDIAAKIDDTHFEFLGREKKEVRIHGRLVNLGTINEMLEKEFSAKSYNTSVINETLIIQVVENPETFVKWCVLTKIEDFEVITVDSIATSGGIKTVNQSLD